MKYQEALWAALKEPTTGEEQQALERLYLAVGVVDAIISKHRSKLCTTFTADEAWRMAAARWSTAFDGMEFIESPTDALTGAQYPNTIAFELHDAVKYGELEENKHDTETMRKLAELKPFEFLALNFMLEAVRDDMANHKGGAEWSFGFLGAEEQIAVR